MVPQPTINNLAYCTNEKCARKPRPCFYTPPASATEADKASRAILSKPCAVCQCPAGFHLQDDDLPDTGPPPQGHPPPQDTTRSSASTGGNDKFSSSAPNGSFRPFKGPPSASDWKSSGQPSFGNAARARKEREQADLKEEFSSSKSSASAASKGATSSKSFNPSTKMHQNTDTTANSSRRGRKNNKKGTQPNVKSTKPHVPKTSKEPKKAAGSGHGPSRLTKYHFVLLPNTSQVHSKNPDFVLRTPSIHQYSVLHENELIQSIDLPANISEEDLDAAVRKLFSLVPPVLNDFKASLSGWVLLKRGKARRGARASLKFAKQKAGQIYWTMENLHWSRFNIGEPLRTTNTVCIALAPGQPDLKLEVDEGEPYSSASEAGSDTLDDESGDEASRDKSDDDDDNLEDDSLASSDEKENCEPEPQEPPLFVHDSGSELDVDDPHYMDYTFDESSFAESNQHEDSKKSHTRSPTPDVPEAEGSPNLDQPPRSFTPLPETPLPASYIPQLYRLTRNLTNPSATTVPNSLQKGEAQLYWTEPKGDVYDKYHDLNEVIHEQRANLLKKDYKSPEAWQTWSIDEVFDQITEELLPTFVFILDAVPATPEPHPILPTPCPPENLRKHSQAFARNVRFGPKGMDMLLEHLFDLYSTLIMAYDCPDNMLDTQHVHLAVKRLNDFGNPLFKIVTKYRARFGRHLLDPPGFAELHDAVRTGTSGFPIAEDGSFRSLGSSMSPLTDDCVTLSTRLICDFESAEWRHAMSSKRLLFGEHGIPGIINKVIVPILDERPMDGDYVEILEMLSTFCQELSLKITSYKKGSKRSRNSEGPSDEARYNTRGNKKSKLSTSPEPTTSHAEDEATDEQPAFGTRRSRQAGRDYPQPQPSFAREEFTRPAASEEPEVTPLTELEKELAAFYGDCMTLKKDGHTRQVLKRVLDTYPHPDPKKRKTWDDFTSAGYSQATLWKKVITLYHSDKNDENVEYPDNPDWSKIAGECTRVITAVFAARS